jgi:hypothetical protein
MAHRIKQVFLRSAMGIVAGDTGFRPWRDPLMGFDKTGCLLIMALGAEFADRDNGQ